MHAKRRRSSLGESSKTQLPPNPRRRSSRRNEQGILEQDAGKRLSNGDDGQGYTLRNPKQEVLESEHGVRLAVKSLSEMEKRLHNAVKRQRLAVEASDLVVEPDQPVKRAFHPRILRGSKKEVINEKTVDTGHSHSLDSGKITPTNGVEMQEVVEEVAAAVKDADEAPERGAARDPPVNSNYLPLPWKGRLGYACLNTYLRAAKQPVFSSRTCRIASILEHRHPLQDPSQAEHPTKNRPDKTKPANIELGQRFVEDLGLANARDIVKMLRWNSKYGIKFMRLSSEMFPFASHKEYGYKLAPFASNVLAEAGKVAAELGHRLTTHPGQFTQLGSPREEVISAAIRDLDYHDELLTLLRLPEQQDRDAVMVLHMGGAYGDKASALDRFRTNYAKLSPSVKRRLVLENDDVVWSVNDLLPVCEELNIPMVLDFHHHNIIFDACSLREGTADIVKLFDRIRNTWTRKGITQKMHYSEPCRDAVTPRDRRKHSPRVRTLPPCAPDMDLMIEAKDKEQAVFELMRNFKLPGYDLFNDIIPFEREDEDRPINGPKQAKLKKNGRRKKGDEIKMDEKAVEADTENDDEKRVSPEDYGMGGPHMRVCWPEGMDEWLRPKKREAKKPHNTKVLKDDEDEAGGGEYEDC